MDPPDRGGLLVKGKKFMTSARPPMSSRPQQLSNLRELRNDFKKPAIFQFGTVYISLAGSMPPWLLSTKQIPRPPLLLTRRATAGHLGFSDSVLCIRVFSHLPPALRTSWH